MAREILDEEPFDIELDDESFEVETEDESGSEALSEADLDKYEEDLATLRKAKEATEAALAEAQDIAREALEAAERSRQQQQPDPAKALLAQKQEISGKLVELRKKLKAAFEEGDADKHAEITEEMSALKGQEQLILLVEENQKNQPPPRKAPQAPKIHPKAQAWRAKNSWFDTNPEAGMAAVAYANMLESRGVTPAMDTYYEEIDRHMRKRYPEVFENEAPKRKKEPPPVKAVERGGGESEAAPKRKRKVELTPLQVRIAKQWNIPPEKMAQEIVAQERRAKGGK